MDKAKDYSRISIITVCFNSAKTIEQTILSVVNQTCRNIEYIIIDGGSTDSTIDVIKRYEDKITYWISEPDKGIYDAMNKGIKIATGDYIYFVGSDDYLYNDDIITQIASQLAFDEKIDILCGRVMVVDFQLKMQKESGNILTLDDIRNGRMAPHQGMFVKSMLLKTRIFDTSYRLAADYEFFMWAALQDVSIYYSKAIIAYYRSDGASSSGVVKDEYIRVVKKYLDPMNFEKYMIQQRRENRWWQPRNLMKTILFYLGLKKIVRRMIGWQVYVEKNYKL